MPLPIRGCCLHVSLLFQSESESVGVLSSRLDAADECFYFVPCGLLSSNLSRHRKGSLQGAKTMLRLERICIHNVYGISV